MNSKKNESKSATEQNLLSREAAVSEIRRMTKKVKACKNYTAAIGDDLVLIPDLLALVRDSSDGYPGIAGIGRPAQFSTE